MFIFGNDYYLAKIDDSGNLQVNDINGNVLINNISYHATYGVIANNVEDIAVGYTHIDINHDEVEQFSIGDTVELHTGAINNSLIATVEITEIEGNRIHFTPAISKIGEEAEYPSRSVKKVTHEINGLTNILTSEDLTETGKVVKITGKTPVSTITIKINFKNENGQICFETTTKYNADVKVFNEKLNLLFSLPATKVFNKNRKVDTTLRSSHYWLDKQGAYFGTGEQSVFLYHAPKVSSLELLVPEKTLVVNLDDMRDHHYRWMKPSERRYKERHASEHVIGDVRTNAFDIWVGNEVNVPRFMFNPEGYLATYIWTEHADRAYMDSQRATVFGSSEVTHIDDAVGGFAKHGIPMTKSVFYDAQAYDFISVINHPDSPEFIDFLKQIHEVGFDICLHSGGYRTSLRPVNEVMMPHMKQEFGSNVWIDHMADYNREDISADGLMPPEELGLKLEESAYVKDLWEENEVKYFWTYSSEDNRLPDTIDLLRPNEPSARTPLYWKHPTVTYDFYTWATTRLASHSLSASWWNNLLSMSNLDRLVDDWGVSINHGYFAYKPNTGIMQSIDEKLQLHPTFDGILRRMASYKEDKKINVTTVNNIMDYWLAIEDIEITYLDDEVILKNNSGSDIKNLSMAALNAEKILVNEVEPDFIVDQDNTIFWFNLNADQTVTIKVETIEHDHDELTIAQKRLKMNYNRYVGIGFEV